MAPRISAQEVESQPHPGKQGNQIYLGDRGALPILTLRCAQRADVKGSPLLPKATFVGVPLLPRLLQGGFNFTVYFSIAGRWGCIKKIPRYRWS